MARGKLPGFEKKPEKSKPFPSQRGEVKTVKKEDKGSERFMPGKIVKGK